MDTFETEITYGACQRYLESLAANRKEETTKAEDREPLRGRRSNTMKWKIRTPEMTDEEYAIAIKVHRAKLAKIWRQNNPNYHKKYNSQHKQK